MVTTEQGNARIPEIRNVPYLDVVATLSEAGGRLRLVLRNRKSKAAVEVRLKITGFHSPAQAEIETLAASSRGAVSSEEHLHVPRSTRQVTPGNFQTRVPALQRQPHPSPPLRHPEAHRADEPIPACFTRIRTERKTHA
jgi:alpha-L-arabinofuranosidase